MYNYLLKKSYLKIICHNQNKFKKNASFSSELSSYLDKGDIIIIQYMFPTLK